MAVKNFGHLWTSYRRNYLLEGRRFEADAKGEVKGGPDEIGFDAISEYVLRDEAAAEQMKNITQEDYDLMKEDEGIWFDQMHCWSVTCETVEEPGLG